ncbi:MAG: hypothetical protein WB471_15965, partial [Nocardioides sp.]
MSDKRPGSSGPSDGPEFGWLYGKGRGDEATQGESPGAGPDATRHIPVQPRPQGYPPPDATAVRPAVSSPTHRQGPPSTPAGGGFWSRRLRRPG